MSTRATTSLAELGLFDVDCPDRVEVTTHAALAWLERVDAEEPYPTGAIRDAWNRAEPTPRHPAAKAVDGLYLVYDIRRNVTVILTVYPVRREP